MMTDDEWIERFRMATTKELEQLERTSRPRVTPNMRKRHTFVVAELKKRGVAHAG